MSLGILAATIHRWAAACRILEIDTVFRAPLSVGAPATVRVVVTNLKPSAGTAQINLTITNAANETRVLGTATVGFPNTA